MRQMQVLTKVLLVVFMVGATIFDVFIKFNLLHTIKIGYVNKNVWYRHRHTVSHKYGAARAFNE